MGVDGEGDGGGEVLIAGSRLERVITADGGDRSGQLKKKEEEEEEAAGGGTRTEMLSTCRMATRHTPS